MSLNTHITSHIAYLRRYARALTGSQADGDAYVRATLETILADADLKKSLNSERASLYKAFHTVWTGLGETQLETVGAHPRSPFEDAVQSRLAQITPLNRQALLLTSLEDFSIAETADILGVPEEGVRRMLEETMGEIDQETATDVLIIEDEPLISMELESLVCKLGHRVCGIAATRVQAQIVLEKHRPGLVLADIQLADGSSGLDAVEDILVAGSVPVVFITAHPEYLLTGDRPEPAYLVTKPFQQQTVRTAISQALFFRARPAA